MLLQVSNYQRQIGGHSQAILLCLEYSINDVLCKTLRRNVGRGGRPRETLAGLVMAEAKPSILGHCQHIAGVWNFRENLRQKLNPWDRGMWWRWDYRDWLKHRCPELPLMHQTPLWLLPDWRGVLQISSNVFVLACVFSGSPLVVLSLDFYRKTFWASQQVRVFCI